MPLPSPKPSGPKASRARFCDLWEYGVADEGLTYLHKQHSESQDKYTYFLLAVTASAVAFAVQKTEMALLTWSLIPMALALLLWAISFYCGCKNLIWVQTATMSNYNLLQLQAGIHPQQPLHPQLLEVATRVTSNCLTSNIEQAMFYGIWQFRLLIAGAVFFLTWHITGIVTRTYPPPYHLLDFLA